MKLFQKSALAVAIAAVPFLSVNAMEALDDATLSEMTGQAGVTIETTVDGTEGITIGSITYTDTLSDPAVTGEIGGGSVLITGNAANEAGITLQGQRWNGTAWENGNSTTKQTIDVDVHGNLITETVAADGYRTVTVDGEDINITAQKISVGQVLLQSQTQTDNYNGEYASVQGAQLVSNLKMTMESGDSSAHILNLSEGNGAAAVAAYQAAYNTDNTDPGNPELINGSITKGLGEVNTAPTGDPSNGSGALGSGAKMAIVTKGKSRIADLSVDALDGAISISGLSYGGGVNGDELMDSTQVIWAKGGAAADGGGVYIQGSDSIGTLIIQEIAIGGGAIGSVAIRDINRAGSVTRIYGH